MTNIDRISYEGMWVKQSIPFSDLVSDFIVCNPVQGDELKLKGYIFAGIKSLKSKEYMYIKPSKLMRELAKRTLFNLSHASLYHTWTKPPKKCIKIEDNHYISRLCIELSSYPEELEDCFKH